MRRIPTRSAWISAALALAALAACRAPAHPHPALDGCHPACPGAPAVALEDPGASLRGAPAVAAPVPESAPAPSAAAYLCPMHPHVGADEPGRCPECGMRLVPRAEVLEHGHAH